jgi:hypothetical protein
MDPLIELPALSQKHAARYAPYRTPRRAKAPRTKVRAMHLQRRELSPGTPVAGGSNPGPKRSGPADGALPVEVHLRSWGKERDQSGAEVVRPGSYPVSRVVPKKPSRMPLPSTVTFPTKCGHSLWAPRCCWPPSIGWYDRVPSGVGQPGCEAPRYPCSSPDSKGRP